MSEKRLDDLRVWRSAAIGALTLLPLLTRAVRRGRLTGWGVVEVADGLRVQLLVQTVDGRLYQVVPSAR